MNRRPAATDEHERLLSHRWAGHRASRHRIYPARVAVGALAVVDRISANTGGFAFRRTPARGHPKDTAACGACERYPLNRTIGPDAPPHHVTASSLSSPVSPVSPGYPGSPDY